VTFKNLIENSTIISKHFGSFKIVEKIGQGGMGYVHKVYSEKWGVFMAMKSPILTNNNESAGGNYRAFIRSDENSDIVRGFFKESHSWMALPVHQNIVTCFYSENILDSPRLFIEYLEGISLRKYIEDGQVQDWKTILDIAIQIANGIAHTHRHDLIHGDLNPRNILVAVDKNKSHKQSGFVTAKGAPIDLTRYNQDSKEKDHESLDVKVTDFGLVKNILFEEKEKEMQERISHYAGLVNQRVGAAPLKEPHNDDSGFLGTPDYAAPEQWSKEYGNIGKETDVYAFGLLLFELITGGKKLYQIPEKYKTAVPGLQIGVYRKMHCEYLIPNIEEEIKKYRNDCPASLSLLITSCIQRRPEKRLHIEKSKMEGQFNYFEYIERHLRDVYNEILDNQYDKNGNSHKGYIFPECIIYYYKGIGLIHLGWPTQAIEYFNTVIKINPNNGYAYVGIAIALAHSELFSEALEASNRAIEIDPLIVEAYDIKSNALNSLGRHKEALEASNRAIEIDPDLDVAYINRGNAFLGIGMLAEALKEYIKAIEMRTNSNFANYDNTIALAYHGKSNALITMGRYNEALEASNRAIEIDPIMTQAIITKAACLNSLRRYNEALEASNRAIEIDPLDFKSYANKSISLYNLRRYHEAIEASDKAIELRPDVSDIYINKAISLANIGKYTEAIEAINISIYLESNNALAYSNKGWILSKSGRKKEAKEYYKIAKHLGKK
jgi:tetratricopeptide (TPR) repeat protein